MNFHFNIETIKDQLENGEIDALPIIAEIKKAEKRLQDLRGFAMEFAIDEFDMQSEKTYILNGFEFSKTTGGRYSYNHSEEWKELNDRRKALEAKMQTACKSNMSEMVDGDTGEVIHAAIYRHNKESISVKL